MRSTSVARTDAPKGILSDFKIAARLILWPRIFKTIWFANCPKAKALKSFFQVGLNPKLDNTKRNRMTDSRDVAQINNPEINISEKFALLKESPIDERSTARRATTIQARVAPIIKAIFRCLYLSILLKRVSVLSKSYLSIT